MKWSRVKWLLIACLLAVDCLLSVQLLRQYYGQHMISRAAAADLADLLSSSGIHVSPETIPSRMEKDDVYRYAYSEKAYQDALTAMVRSPLTGTYLLPNSTGTSLTFENGDTAVYYHNLYMTYQHGGDDHWSPLIESYLTSAGDFPEAEGHAASEAVRTAETFLSAMTEGISSPDVRLRPHLRAVYKTKYDTVLLCVFTEEAAKSSGRFAAEITGTELCMLVEGETVWYMAGTWIPFVPDEVFRTAKKSQLDILFSEKKRLDRSAAESGIPTDCTVETLERTYYMLWDSENHLYLRPAWRIVYAGRQENGASEEILCDAVTGDVVLFHAAAKSAVP